MKLKISYGYSVLEPTQRFENGRIVLGGILTTHDSAGNILEQKHTDSVTVGYEDREMTEFEALELMG